MNKTKNEEYQLGFFEKTNQYFLFKELLHFEIYYGKVFCFFYTVYS